MAHFIADIQGSRGPTSRLGTKQSGIDATITGWDIGCAVSIRYDEDMDEDVITITKTGGSSHNKIVEESVRWIRPVDHSRPIDSKCPIDTNHRWDWENEKTNDIPICKSKIKRNRKGDTWMCTRPENHEGNHHAHFYNGTCKREWTTEEAVVEAL